MTPIPRFPAFRSIEITDRPLIEAIVGDYPPYSDYSFTSLFAWDTDEEHPFAISCLNGNLAVKFTDYTSNERFWSFIGTSAAVDTARTLLRHANEAGLPAELRLVPSAVIDAEPDLPRYFSIREDENNNDYVCSVAEWAALAGPRFARHRAQIGRCRPRCRFTFRELYLDDPADQKAMIGLVQAWLQQKSDADGEDHAQELVAIQRLFSLAPDGRLRASGIADGARLVGFAIWEPLPDGIYAVGHFAKADRSYEGLAASVHQDVCRRLHGLGYQLINIEQDLGIAGLRTFKRSMRPCRMLEKVVIAEQRDRDDDEHRQD